MERRMTVGKQKGFDEWMTEVVAAVEHRRGVQDVSRYDVEDEFKREIRRERVALGTRLLRYLVGRRAVT
jgi:hypothetical protein